MGNYWIEVISDDIIYFDLNVLSGIKINCVPLKQMNK